ncbi:MAG: TonB-dependent receptor [Calditrichaeota bacterium]|nr:TonB-dependent receptor [Calditrichota bacterium]
MKKSHNILFILFLHFSVSFAEPNTGSIRGLALNRTTREPIYNVNVVLFGSDKGAASDSSGRFLIAGLKPGTWTLQVSALGYRSEAKSDIAVMPGRSAEVEFLLEPAAVEASEVVFRTGYFRPRADLPTSSRALHFEEIRRAPGAAEDVQRVIQALPGVAGANDQTNEIVVRGGNPTENLTIIDGIEIDNINHFPNQSSSGGPISAVNIAFLKDVSFTTGGFSARYGDKLSSVLNLELREGSRDRLTGEGELTMAGAGFNSEGPLFSGRGAFLYSARISYIDLLKGPIGLTAVPHYWDSQFKGVYDLSPKSKVSIFGMLSRDWITIESEDPDAWTRGAETVDAHYNRLILGARLRSVARRGYSECILAHTTTDFKEQVWEMPERRTIFLNKSNETIDQFSYMWSGQARRRDEWSAGFDIKPITFNFDRWFQQDTVVYDFNYDGLADTTVISPVWQVERSQTAVKGGAFLQYRWRPAHRWLVGTGLRYDGFDLSHRHTLAPRLSLRWDIAGSTALNVAVGRYYQTHSLVVYTYDPAGSTERLPHAQADHYIAGLSYQLSSGMILTLEGYYKDYRSLPVSEEHLQRDLDPTFRSYRYLAVGRKQAQGMELFLQQKALKNWYGTLSYSYGRSEFDDSRERYPADYDFRHVGTLVWGWTTSLIRHSWFNRFQRSPWGWWTYALPLNGDEVTLSTRWRYVSGRPYTPRVWTDVGPELDYHWEAAGALNSARYPIYNRLDLRWDSKWFAGKRAVVVALEVQNLLDRKNIAEYIYSDDGERQTAHQFRFFFVGGVRVEF